MSAAAPANAAAAADAAAPAAPKGTKGPATAPPPPPQSVGSSDEEDEDDRAVVRSVPCCRCLWAMSVWHADMADAEAKFPCCLETTTASNKCSWCAEMRGKECATCAMTSAALALKNVFKALCHDGTVCANYRYCKAKAEEEEWLLCSRKVAALKASAAAATSLAKSAKSGGDAASVAPSGGEDEEEE
ncbi:uncharacterized protein GLRG_11640 [Colletotrichum graminicola M1.001]|uniref:Uncharacterized protein n=1 Tax=Colletotrichum graminicola (strain M1.001 / M2 / FGSC 10212) TaxID=645133 RepID=E3R057_COLGM|nr:uncharacterized protein GLRG_11640 [Colletotrichum graminicola M1.001]EFQ36495.1 hypothetical protein GLRG_11640 [Colletotrichum graminicola M1.001]